MNRGDIVSVIERIEEAGVVGVGGAGFPTHVKYKADIEYLIINAAECEPLLKTDHYVMKNHALEVIKGIDIMKKETGAKHAVIATKAYYKEEITALEAAKVELGSDVSFHLMENFYPSGDEFIMVYEVTGRVVPPAGIPLMVGCVVSNISTMLNIYHAIVEQKPVTSKRLTVTGAVGEPTLLEVPIGTSFEKCLEAAGGTTLETYLFIDGGPMMGKLHSQDELAQKVVTKTTSGLIVVENSGYLKKFKDETLDQIFDKAKLACIDCSLCSQLCPRQMIGHDISPHKVMHYFSKVEMGTEVVDNEILRGALICSSCGVCEIIACPRGLSPRQVNNYVKREFAKQNIRYKNEKTEFEIDPIRDCKATTSNNILIKFGLLPYVAYQLDEVKVIDTDEVFIPLNMHIGSPSIPIVNAGDKVDVGDLIAKTPAGALGANIHASISGNVIGSSAKNIHIKKI